MLSHNDVFRTISIIERKEYEISESNAMAKVLAKSSGIPLKTREVSRLKEKSIV